MPKKPSSSKTKPIGNVLRGQSVVALGALRNVVAYEGVYAKQNGTQAVRMVVGASAATSQTTSLGIYSHARTALNIGIHHMAGVMSGNEVKSTTPPGVAIELKGSFHPDNLSFKSLKVSAILGINQNLERTLAIAQGVIADLNFLVKGSIVQGTDIKVETFGRPQGLATGPEVA